MKKTHIHTLNGMNEIKKTNYFFSAFFPFYLHGIDDSVVVVALVLSSSIYYEREYGCEKYF